MSFCLLTWGLSVQRWCWPFYLSLSLQLCVWVYGERTKGHVCVSPWMSVCLFDWLTLLTSLIWTIKSVAVLRHEGYDGWSSQHLSLPLTPRPTSPDLDPVFNFYSVHSFSVIPAALIWGRSVRGSAEEAGCEGVNLERGVSGGYFALMGLLVS